MFFNSSDMYFQISQIVKLNHKNGFFRVPPRSFAAISIRLQGQGFFKFQDGESFAVNKGDITFFPANVGYDAEYRNSTVIVIHLLSCDYLTPENVKLNHHSYIFKLFDQLLEKWEKKCTVNILKSALYQLFAKIEEDMLSNVSDSFQKCNMYIDEHFLEYDLKMTDVCINANTSESSLYRYFMSYYGISPKQYLLKLRLNHAVELLLKGEYSVEETALKSGFADPKYFSRIFKKYMGVPPSQYYNLGY